MDKAACHFMSPGIFIVFDLNSVTLSIEYMYINKVHWRGRAFRFIFTLADCWKQF